MTLLSLAEIRSRIVTDLENESLQQIVDAAEAEIYGRVKQFAFLRSYNPPLMCVEIRRASGDDLWAMNAAHTENARIGVTDVRINQVQWDGTLLTVYGNDLQDLFMPDEGDGLPHSLYFVSEIGNYVEIPTSELSGTLNTASITVWEPDSAKITALTSWVDGIPEGDEFGFAIADPNAWYPHTPTEHIAVKRDALVDLVKLGIQYSGHKTVVVGDGGTGMNRENLDYAAERIALLGRLDFLNGEGTFV